MWSACLLAGKFDVFLQGKQLHACKKGKGLWRFLSILLLFGEEEGPGKLESVHTWTWVVIYNNEFLKTRIFFFAEECGIGICESEKLLIFDFGLNADIWLYLLFHTCRSVNFCSVK